MVRLVDERLQVVGKEGRELELRRQLTRSLSPASPSRQYYDNYVKVVVLSIPQTSHSLLSIVPIPPIIITKIYFKNALKESI